MPIVGLIQSRTEGPVTDSGAATGSSSVAPGTAAGTATPEAETTRNAKKACPADVPLPDWVFKSKQIGKW